MTGDNRSRGQGSYGRLRVNVGDSRRKRLIDCVTASSTVCRFFTSQSQKSSRTSTALYHLAARCSAGCHLTFVSCHSCWRGQSYFAPFRICLLYLKTTPFVFSLIGCHGCSRAVCSEGHSRYAGASGSRGQLQEGNDRQPSGTFFCFSWIRQKLTAF